LNPAYLRYFYASKLSAKVDDIDLNITEFVNKVNADLVGKVVNLASRSAKFLQKSGLSEKYPDDGGLFEQGAQAGEEIAAAYEACDYARAMRLIMELADRANPYVENAEPWKLTKDPDKAQQLQDICTVAINLFRQLAVYLAPVLPGLAQQTSDLLGAPVEIWSDSQTPLTGTPVNKFKHMLKRAEEKKFQAVIEEEKENLPPLPALPPGEEPMAPECTIDDFVKIDLRIAEVVNAEHVEGAEKLLKLTLNLGGEANRTVFAGIKAAYKPEELKGRLVVCVANLKPRKMKFGLSEGMVAAAGPGGADVFLLGVAEGGKPGMRIH